MFSSYFEKKIFNFFTKQILYGEIFIFNYRYLDKLNLVQNLSSDTEINFAYKFFRVIDHY